MTTRLPDTDTQMERLRAIEAVLAAPEPPGYPLPVNAPYFCQMARASEARAVQMEAQMVHIREHAQRAGLRGDDPRLMQTAKKVSDARRERDGWITRADDLLKIWQRSLPAPSGAQAKPPKLLPPARRVGQRR